MCYGLRRRLTSSLLLFPYLFVLHVGAKSNRTLLRSLNLPNVTISDAAYVTAGTNLTTSADPTYFLSTFVNRVTGVVKTSPTSSVKFEVWLPDTWCGCRTPGVAEFLPEGMPVSEGVSSFISFNSRDSTSTDHKFVRFQGTPYPTLDEGAFLSFATIATNGGHDGNFDPTPFILPAGIESLTDFAIAQCACP